MRTLKRLLLPGHNFIVSIGIDLFSFAKVSNLTTEVEYETVAEGGNNQYPYLFQKTKTKPDTLTLEKGVRVRFLDLRSHALSEGTYVKDVMIILYGNMGLERAFYFQKGMIVRKRFSDLDAMKNEVLIQSLEIAHSGLVDI